uniref:Ropporin-1-like protein n=1 Tax=Gasterosteus aculeatus aculeatus TaxID=481459 RepID=A0AAQ4R7U1_GASAC
MPLPDTMFCAQQIDIAQELPDILKNFTKAAVRTQPEDLLLWSAAYFTALSKGERLPVKDRLELNVTHKTDSAMTPGLLKTLHKQGAPMRDDKTAGLHPFGGYEPNCFLSFKLFHKKPHQKLIQNDEGQK